MRFAEKEYSKQKLRHVCESCGRVEIITPEQAYEEGWDYPPLMGVYGVVSPRTCPKCTMDTTVYWKLMTEGKAHVDLNEHDKTVLERILGEPGSLIP